MDAYFNSLMAYLIYFIFLGICGALTWLIVSNIFVEGRASLDVFFSFGAFWSLFFVIPAITMRSIAEENKAGTIELLTTKAVSDWEIIIGKFLAAFLLVCIALLCTVPYYITISNLGNIDDGAVVGGYLGLLLIAATYIAIGIFASSLTQNQIVAFLIAIVVEVLLQFMFGWIAAGLKGGIGEVLIFLSVNDHYESIRRGVIDSRDLIFFFSLIALALFGTHTMMSKRNWQS